MTAARGPDLTGIAPLLSGLRMRPPDWRRALVAVFASILGVAAFIALLDIAVFRAALPADYVAFYTSPLMPRTAITCLRAAMDEVMFRLILMTSMVIALSAWRGPLTPRLFVAVIVASQLADVGALVAADPVYASLRYWAVGCVWGWLYWRHGWLAALAGHGMAHLVLDPVLAFGLVRS